MIYGPCQKDPLPFWKTLSGYSGRSGNAACHAESCVCNPSFRLPRRLSCSMLRVFVWSCSLHHHSAMPLAGWQACRIWRGISVKLAFQCECLLISVHWACFSELTDQASLKYRPSYKIAIQIGISVNSSDTSAPTGSGWIGCGQEDREHKDWKERQACRGYHY